MISILKKCTYRLPVLGVVSLLVITGCASSAIRTQVQTGTQASQKAVSSLMIRRKSALKAISHTTLTSKLPYVNVVAIPYQQTLPALFHSPASASIPRLPAWRFASMLSSLTGLHVLFSQGILYHNNRSVSRSRGTVDATLTAPVTTISTHIRVADLGPFNFHGTLHGMLNYLANMLDAQWSYNPTTNTIRVFRTEIKVFHIATLPGDLTISDKLSGGGGSSSGITGQRGQTIRTGSAQTDTNFKGTLSVWTAVSKTIHQMLSESGSMVVSQPLSEISVRDNWHNVEAIARYVKKINQSMTQQVSVSVKVYQVRVNNDSKQGISWQALYNSLGQLASTAGARIITPSSQFINTGAMVFTPPSFNSSGRMTPWSGSQFFVQALSTLGKVSTVINTSVETVNNVPAPFKSYLLTSYLASTTPSLYSGGGGGGGSAITGASAGLTPGSVQTGISLQVLPSIQPDGQRILTQISLSISVLNGMQTVSSAGQSIQVPSISGDELMPRVMLRSGESLVIPALISSKNNATTNTPFGRSSWAFGGNQSLIHSRDALVLVITPVAISNRSTL